MKNFRFLFQLFAFSLLLLILPTLASAQFGGNRDYEDDRYRNNGRYNNNNYDGRPLRDAINRVEERADDFKDDFDRALDDSRVDGTRREDRLNGVAREFERAADALRSSFNGRNLNTSAGNAQRLLQIGSQLDRFVNSRRLESNSNRYNRLIQNWARISQDLNIISNAYRNNGNRGYDRNNRDYDYDDDNNNRRNNRRNRGNNRRGNYYPF